MAINFVSLSNDAVFSGIQLSKKQMPLNPIGNKEVDREITRSDVEELNRKQTLSEFNQQVEALKRPDVNKEAESHLPWTAIMQQLQLQPTGDEEQDFNSIMEEIQFQIENAQSLYDKNYYSWLQEHTTRTFMSNSDFDNSYFEDNYFVHTLSQNNIINVNVL